MTNKFQTGGQVFFSAVANPYSNQAIADRTTAAKQTSKSQDQGLIPKELLLDLYKKGIPVDVDNFVQQVAALEKRIDQGLPVSNSAVYRLQAKANRVIQQAEYLKEAEKIANQNNALGEIAVGNSGELFTLDQSGNVKKISMTQYDIEKHGPALTVNELVKQRKFNPDQAFDVDLTSVVSSNVGMTNINDQIKKIITVIGESTSAQEAYIDLASLYGKGAKRPTQAEFETISQIAKEWQNIGEDAIFKVSKQVSRKNLDDALNYIIQALPRNVRIQLQARNVAEGIPYKDSGKQVLNLITSALSMSDDVKQIQKIDYEGDLNKRVNPTKSGGSSKSFYQTPNEAFFDGDLNKTNVEITDNAYGNKYKVRVKGVQMPSLTTDNGKALTNLPLGVALQNSILKYTNKDKIFLGEQKITEGMLNNIAYTGDQVAAVYMPVKSNGDIDWQGFHAYSQAEQYIEENNITDLETKKAIHARFGSYAQFDAQGNIKPTDNVAKYILTYGYTIDKQIDNDNSMVEELTGKEEDAADLLIEQIYNKHLKNTTGVTGIEGKHIWNDIFKVPIFIKVDDKASGDAYRYGGHGSNLTPKSLQEDMLSDLANSTPEIRVNGNTSLLYQE